MPPTGFDVYLCPHTPGHLSNQRRPLQTRRRITPSCGVLEVNFHPLPPPVAEQVNPLPAGPARGLTSGSHLGSCSNYLAGIILCRSLQLPAKQLPQGANKVDTIMPSAISPNCLESGDPHFGSFFRPRAIQVNGPFSWYSQAGRWHDEPFTLSR